MQEVTVYKRVTRTEDDRIRLRAWIGEAPAAIPVELFVYQQIPIVPLDTELDKLFVHIASFEDISAFPVDAPGEKSPFFRRYWMDLVFDSVTYQEETWDRIMRMLRHTLNDVVRFYKAESVELKEILM